jgi:hypothetical protein
MVPESPMPRSSRRAALGTLVLATMALAAAGCSSARSELPRSPQQRHVMREQGAAMIDSLVAAHGGMAAWSSVREVAFRSTDEWTGPWARLLNPWPIDRAAGEMRFRVHEGWGRAAIVVDEGTLTYGVGPTGPWALLRGVPSPRPKDLQSAGYLVRWHDFLVGWPFRFKESGAVAHYLGRAHRKYANASQEFDEVLVSYPPEGDVWPDDWFVVRMDPNTHEMRTVTFTTSGRSQRFFETTCEFADYVTIEGIRIATTRRFFISSPVEDPVHTWTLADMRVNQLSPDEYFERRSGSAEPVPGAGVLDSAATLVGEAGQAVGTAAESLGRRASSAVGEAVDTLRVRTGASPR